MCIVTTITAPPEKKVFNNPIITTSKEVSVGQHPMVGRYKWKAFSRKGDISPYEAIQVHILECECAIQPAQVKEALGFQVSERRSDLTVPVPLITPCLAWLINVSVVPCPQILQCLELDCSIWCYFWIVPVRMVQFPAGNCLLIGFGEHSTVHLQHPRLALTSANTTAMVLVSVSNMLYEY